MIFLNALNEYSLPPTGQVHDAERNTKLSLAMMKYLDEDEQSRFFGFLQVCLLTNTYIDSKTFIDILKKKHSNLISVLLRKSIFLQQTNPYFSELFSDPCILDIVVELFRQLEDDERNIALSNIISLGVWQRDSRILDSILRLVQFHPHVLSVFSYSNNKIILNNPRLRKAIISSFREKIKNPDEKLSKFHYLDIVELYVPSLSLDIIDNLVEDIIPSVVNRINKADNVWDVILSITHFHEIITHKDVVQAITKKDDKLIDSGLFRLNMNHEPEDIISIFKNSAYKDNSKLHSCLSESIEFLPIESISLILSDDSLFSISKIREAVIS
ncbi:unnamed protein product, partial [marine sediment metagenome]